MDLCIKDRMEMVGKLGWGGFWQASSALQVEMVLDYNFSCQGENNWKCNFCGVSCDLLGTNVYHTFLCI